MSGRHPETALAPYLRGELAAAERAEVAAHLETCAGCRRLADDFRALLSDLRQSAPEPPPIHPERYQAELAVRLRRRGAAPARVHWLAPLPLALAAGLAGVLLYVGALGLVRPADDLVAFEEAVIGGRLDLLRQYRVVERLDLLEDLDVVRQLDALAPSREG